MTRAPKLILISRLPRPSNRRLTFIKVERCFGESYRALFVSHVDLADDTRPRYASDRPSFIAIFRRFDSTIIVPDIPPSCDYVKLIRRSCRIRPRRRFSRDSSPDLEKSVFDCEAKKERCSLEMLRWPFKIEISELHRIEASEVNVSRTSESQASRE